MSTASLCLRNSPQSTRFFVTIVGEDSLLSCAACGYTSNEERAVGVVPSTPTKTATKFRNSTSVPKWIESFDIVPRSSVRMNPKFQFGLLKESSQENDERTTLVAVATSGDRSVNEIKLAKAIGAVQLVESLDEIKSLLGEQVRVEDMMICVDQSLYPGQPASRPKDDVDFSKGGEIPESLLSVVSGSPQKLRVIYGDYHNCLPGDGCPHCFKNKGTEETEGKFEPLEMRRAIEIGHTFLLGTKYSKPLNAVFHSESNQDWEPIQMGCYGLGITRLLASIIEASHDHKGIIWPEEVAPFRAVIVTSEDEACAKVAENVYDVLQKAMRSPSCAARSSEVVLDDRSETTLGFKMKDAELIGYPWMIVVGKGFLRTGKVEVQQRKTGQKWSLEWPQLAPFFEERRLSEGTLE